MLSLALFVEIIPVLISVAFVTLLERKALGLVGYRLGPSKASFGGFLQPLGDALKLSNKGCVLLYNISFYYYYLSGAFMLLGALSLWVVLFSEPSPASVKHSLLLVLFFLSLNSLNAVFSGWSTLSKYSLIGSMRTVAQLISYEASLYVCLLFPVVCYYSFNLFSMNFYPLLFLGGLLPFVAYVWLPTILAELNRTPYDFSEGESELVSGFNTEFGSSIFTLTFLSEYCNIMFFCLVTFFFFFFFWFTFFPMMVFFIIWVRSVLPRLRFDSLMFLCWKFYIPFLTLMFVLILTLSFC